jgi:hypothetical protein
MLRIGILLLVANISNAYAVASTSITGVYRYSTESAFNQVNGQPLIDGKAAYLNDYAIGSQVAVSNARDGDQWRWEFYHEDGAPGSSARLTFYEEYEGSRDCFIGYIMFHYPTIQCGSTSTWHEVANRTYCQQTGNWYANVRYVPGDGGPEQLFENPVDIVSTGPQVKVR